MTVVVDASVILKWLFNDPEKESRTQEATSLMKAVVDSHLEVLQPIHWAIEVAAVLARKTPNTAENNVRLLAALDLAMVDDADILTPRLPSLGGTRSSSIRHPVSCRRSGTKRCADHRR
jgi:predicted nucleic acid-binding protein